MIIFESIWYGKTVGVNKWHGARALFNKMKKRWIAQVFESKEAKEFKKSMIDKWGVEYQKETFSGYVDAAFSLSMWKMKDSDSCIKFIFDALEESGIIENDRRIRNFHVYRHYHKKSEIDFIKVRLTSVDN